MKKNQLNIKAFKTISELYWDNGYTQSEISNEFPCTQPTVNRVLHGIYQPVEARRYKKKLKYKANFKAPTNEVKQAKTLRCKREKLPSTKLTFKKAKQIRQLYFSGQKDQCELADKFRVNQCTISNIITGKNWKICNC